MRYKIISVCIPNANLIEAYPCLKNLGLEVAYDNFGDQCAYITLDSIEQMMTLIRSVDHNIIVHDYSDYDTEPDKFVIEIYDGWRE